MCILEYTSRIHQITSALKQAEKSLALEQDNSAELSKQLNEERFKIDQMSAERRDAETRMSSEIAELSVRVPFGILFASDGVE